VSLGRVALDGLEDDGVEFGVDGGVFGAGGDASGGPAAGLVGVWLFAGEEGREGEAEAIDVGPLVGGLAGGSADGGVEVAGGAGAELAGLAAEAADDPGDAEVDESWLLAGEDDVGGLDVGVDEVLLVEGPTALQTLVKTSTFLRIGQALEIGPPSGSPSSYSIAT
jgi:hypothetical protein